MTIPVREIGRPEGAIAIDCGRPLEGFRPHKSKGQNFLIQRRITDRIVALAELGAYDDVIEIGPGPGILTDAIMQCVRSLTAIELDTRLAAALNDRWGGRPAFKLISADFLKLPELPGDGSVKIVANLPFNAASAMLERLCAYRHRITRMVLMFQREVAERIRARPGDSAYGALSVYTALYWRISDHFRVSAGSFHPRPKVDAEVLVFVPCTPSPFASADEQTILRTIRASFAAPRKTLRNSLAHGLTLAPMRAGVMLERADINPGARAATLTLEDLLRLASVLKASAITNLDDDGLQAFSAALGDSA